MAQTTEQNKAVTSQSSHLQRSHHGRPDAQRRKAVSRAHRGKRTLTVLPATGCTLAVPKMPRGREWTAQERALWRELWRSPQATMSDDSYSSSISTYIAPVTAVLAGTADGWQATEARQLGDRLGLRPQGAGVPDRIIRGRR